MSAPAASVLHCSPGELRQAARLLRGVRQEVQLLAGRARTMAATGGWLGVAALEQQAHAGRLGQLVTSTGQPQEEVAGALDRCADVVETSATRVRFWNRRAEDLVAELVSLRTMGPPPDPLLEQVWRRRLEEAERELARAWAFVDEAEAVFDAAQRQAAAVVSGAWAAVRELYRLGQLGDQLRKTPDVIARTAVRTVWTTEMVIALARARWARTAPARAAARQRVAVLLERLRRLGRAAAGGQGWLARLRLLPGPLGMVLAWFTAWSDVRTGGGYAGWRGGTTRVLAGGALVGGPLALLTPFAPPAGMVGIALIGLYQAWSIGNAVWDGAPTVVRYARRAGRAGKDLADRGLQVTVRARERVTARLREIRARTAVRTVGLAVRTRERVRDRLDEVADLTERLPGTAPLRDRLRTLGTPIRLPAVPLGPTLRAPVDLGRRWPGRGEGERP